MQTHRHIANPNKTKKLFMTFVKHTCNFAISLNDAQRKVVNMKLNQKFILNIVIKTLVIECYIYRVNAHTPRL